MKHRRVNQLESGEEMSKLIVANWKMNGSLSFIKTFFENSVDYPSSEVVFCPPFPYLKTVRDCFSNRKYSLGAQDCHFRDSGAFTGNVSASMLKDLGCQYVILGHSERRHSHQETSKMVREKAQNALQNRLIPLLCVGESLRDRQSEQHFEVVQQQLSESIPEGIIDPMIIAYEPTWAIGTGLTATVEDIAKMHQMIATHIHHKYKILYGGSVTADNAQEIIFQPNVEGVLVGGASLKYEIFNKIIQAGKKG